MLLCVVAGAIVGMLAMGAVLLITAPDPGPGDWAGGSQSFTGVLNARPSPTLWLPPDATHPQGHTMLLAGEGKNGVDPKQFDNSWVAADGVVLRRGDLEMLQVAGDLRAAADRALRPPNEKLGTWRLSGEICDGKCYAGAMRPGNGLAHRACADLCLIGEVPPVLVTASPVHGQSFLLLGVAGGGEALRDLVAVPVRLDGLVERRGDLLVFNADLATAVR